MEIMVVSMRFLTETVVCCQDVAWGSWPWQWHVVAVVNSAQNSEEFAADCDWRWLLWWPWLWRGILEIVIWHSYCEEFRCHGEVPDTGSDKCCCNDVSDVTVRWLTETVTWAASVKSVGRTVRSLTQTIVGRLLVKMAAGWDTSVSKWIYHIHWCRHQVWDYIKAGKVLGGIPSFRIGVS